MTDFIIKKLPYDLSCSAGLVLIGQYLKRIHLNALVDPAFPVRAGIANSDIVRSVLGLLCQGKSDFEAVEALRASPFGLRALGLTQAPSSATLRQRLDAQGSGEWPRPRRPSPRDAPDRAGIPAETLGAGPNPGPQDSPQHSGRP
jgi:hypothetical protein